MSNKLRLQRVIKSRLELFEKRIAEGWTQKMLLEDLGTEGLITTYKYFNDCLNKARKSKKDGATQKKGVKERVELLPVAEMSKVDIRSSSSKPKESSTGEFKLVNLSDEELYGK